MLIVIGIPRLVVYFILNMQSKPFLIAFALRQGVK